MTIEELNKIKEEIIIQYNNELKQKENTNNPNIIDEELKYIKNEIDKIDELIKIYAVDDIEYRVMKLERLYMQIMTEKNKTAFLNLTPEEEFNIFNNVFPSNWSFEVPIDKKLEYLEKAICTSKMINQIQSKTITRTKIDSNN